MLVKTDGDEKFEPDQTKSFAMVEGITEKKKYAWMSGVR